MKEDENSKAGAVKGSLPKSGLGKMPLDRSGLRQPDEQDAGAKSTKNRPSATERAKARADEKKAKAEKAKAEKAEKIDKAKSAKTRAD